MRPGLALPECGQQPACPPQNGQPSGLPALPLWQAGPPDVAHELERNPQADNRDDPAPERPAAGPALPPVPAFGVNPGAAEPDHEHDARGEDRDVGDLVQPEVDEGGAPVLAAQAQHLDD